MFSVLLKNVKLFNKAAQKIHCAIYYLAYFTVSRPVPTTKLKLQ